MALYDLHRSSALPLSTRASSAFVRLVERVIERRNARRTYEALSHLSEHELRDIGLLPGDLARWR
ncbi:uncharacterized protein DUF1127 [Palleronia aestuarii]|uniref:Uncharacterized protein DUF1127 n=1 Tax=Palleronia aestuarii TaxID=568105 RepID=A0A2W7NSQ9_9RHOB|nr:DUF1127 domain-containing protein [Palleronia aestuarii]PZX19654.1 uncharacterized protein DUF1127 [Palleronia aestuarii]